MIVNLLLYDLLLFKIVSPDFQHGIYLIIFLIIITFVFFSTNANFTPFDVSYANGVILEIYILGKIWYCEDGTFSTLPSTCFFELIAAALNEFDQKQCYN